MLDKAIHKHLDEMDAIGEDVVKQIDDFINDMDIDAILESPEEALTAIVEIIGERIAGPNIKKALEAGEKFARAVEKDGEIVVEDSSDPRRNADDQK